MEVESQGSGPVDASARIHSLDVVRGTVLLGILLMNITMFGMVHPAYSNPTVMGGDTGRNLAAWIVSNVMIEGTQRALFSLLFGAGVILLTSRSASTHGDDPADIYYRRTIWLIVFGLIHSFLLLWTGEILFYYGVSALFLYPARHMSPRRLSYLALALFLSGAIWNFSDYLAAVDAAEGHAEAQVVLDEGGTLTSEQEQAVEDYDELRSDLAPTQEEIDEMVATYRGSYWKILTYQAPINAHWEAWGAYRWTLSDTVSMMLLGMALFKLGVLTLKRSNLFYWTMTLVGYTIGVGVNILETLHIVRGDFSIPAFTATWATYDLGRLGVSAGHLGLLLLFCRSGWLPWLQRSLAAVGRMALSNYVMHSIICGIVFYGFGFGLYGHLQRYKLYFVVVAIWIIQLIGSPIWLKSFRFGPLEWVWRSLTYQRLQPMRLVR